MKTKKHGCLDTQALITIPTTILEKKNKQARLPKFGKANQRNVTKTKSYPLVFNFTSFRPNPFMLAWVTNVSTSPDLNVEFGTSSTEQTPKAKIWISEKKSFCCRCSTFLSPTFVEIKNSFTRTLLTFNFKNF